MKFGNFLAPAALTLTLLATGASAQSRIETVVDGLNYPWDIAVEGNGLMLTEKGGNLVRVGIDGRMVRQAVETSVPIHDNRGRGLLGMAMAPDGSGTVYLYHSVREGGVLSNRVITARLEGGVWHETGEIIAGIPGHPLYNGGRLAFGPDGMLYVTTGWIERPDLPQDPASLAGKILRLTPEGAVPTDNPIPGSPVWSMGHRNPQGLAWDDEEQLFAAEHGGGGHDEINRIIAGTNYGWPDYQGDARDDGITPPEVHSGSSTWAPSGLTFYDGKFVIAALRSEGLLRWTPGAGEVEVAADTGIRMRDAVVLEGVIYAITTERSPRGDGPSRDRLLRITP